MCVEYSSTCTHDRYSLSNEMLRLTQRGSARLVRALNETGVEATEVFPSAARASQAARIVLTSSSPQTPITRTSTARGNGVSLDVETRRALDTGIDLGAPRFRSRAPVGTQWRGLSSGGAGKGGKEEGVFDRLKRTFEEEVDKVRAHVPCWR